MTIRTIRKSTLAKVVAITLAAATSAVYAADSTSTQLSAAVASPTVTAVTNANTNTPAVTTSTTTQQLTPSATQTPAVTATQTATPTPTQQTAIKQASTSAITSNSKIISFSEQASVLTFTYNYKNYQSNLDKMEAYFTKNGWLSFNKALTQSKNLKVIQDEKLSVIAKLNGKAKILAQKSGAGNTLWEVQVPLQVTYKNDQNNQIQQYLLVKLSIIKSNTTKTVNDIGVGIRQFVATPAPIKPTNPQVQTKPQLQS